jgi:hypothetical protein
MLALGVVPGLMTMPRPLLLKLSLLAQLFSKNPPDQQPYNTHQITAHPVYHLPMGPYDDNPRSFVVHGGALSVLRQKCVQVPPTLLHDILTKSTRAILLVDYSIS